MASEYNDDNRDRDDISQQDLDDAAMFQQLTVCLSSMNLRLASMEQELKILNRETAHQLNHCAQSLTSTINRNAQLGHEMNLFLAPVIKALRRHEGLENPTDENEDESTDPGADGFVVVSAVSQFFPPGVLNEPLGLLARPPKKSELLTCLEKLIETDEKLVEDCRAFKAQCELDHRNCNIAKSVATPVAVAGTIMSIVGIAAAIPTGGLSLFLTWGGATTALVGGATNAGVEITKKVIMDNIGAKFQKQCDARSIFQAEYALKSKIFNDVVEKVIETGTDTNYEDVCRLVYVLTEMGGISLTSISSYVSRMRAITESLRTGEPLSGGNHGVDQSPRQEAPGGGKGGAIAGTVSLAAGRSVAKFVGSELKGITSVFGSEGAKLSGKVLGSAAAGIGVIFIAVDIGFLINDWVSGANLSAPIQKEIDRIEEGLVALREEKKKLEGFSCLLDRVSVAPSPTPAPSVGSDGVGVEDAHEADEGLELSPWSRLGPSRLI